MFSQSQSKPNLIGIGIGIMIGIKNAYFAAWKGIVALNVPKTLVRLQYNIQLDFGNLKFGKVV